MDNQPSKVKLELHCDLVQAANFYNVELEEVELKTYITEFSIGKEDSKSAINIECRGCNEQIAAHVIEFPRINNFISSKFAVQIVIILGLTFLPFINLSIDPIAVFAIVGFGVFVFLSDIFTFIFRPPANLDTPLFWHKIKHAK